MITPKYWARAIVDEDGYEIDHDWGFTGIGWSDLSEQEAQTHALKRARSLREWIVVHDFDGHNGFGNTYYHNNVLREPVINELYNDSGTRLAVVTRNIYGAYVLNAAQVMFIDIDLPPQHKSNRRSPTQPSFFARLFGKQSPPESDPVEASKPTPADRILGLVAEHQEMGIKLYRTPNGLRGLVTNRLYKPGSDETQTILKTFGSDELYNRLCRAQQCFRARLTPKPWRIGMDLPPRNFPFTNPSKQDVFDQWSATYEARIGGYAACEVVKEEIIGNPTIHPDIAPVLKLHDELARSLGSALA